MPTVIPQASNAHHSCACCSLPFDFVKTRIQKMEKGPDGKYPYSGPVDCAMQTFRKEGPLKFYTGFPTYCIRCACTLQFSVNGPLIAPVMRVNLRGKYLKLT